MSYLYDINNKRYLLNAYFIFRTCADQRLPEDKRRLFKALVSLPDVLESRTRKSLKRDQSSLIKPNIDNSDDEY